MGDLNRANKLTTPEDIQQFFIESIASKCSESANTITEMLRLLPTKQREFILEETLKRGYHETAWMFREAGRSTTEEYASANIPGDTSTEDLLNRLLRKNIAHFVHRSKDELLHIAYTPNEQYGKQDRQVKTTVGRYLKKNYPDLSDADIRSASDAYRYYFGVEDIRWATTAEDIERVYTTGPHSCMAYEWTDRSERYGSHIHPSAAYADLPWFKLAYLERNGRINARCLTYINPENPEDKRWIRIYGDELLRTKLENSGYVKGNLEGARINKIPAESFEGDALNNTYVCPYIDDETKSSMYALRATDDDDFLEIGHGFKYSGTNTTGLTGDFYSYLRSNSEPEDDEQEGSVECDVCGERVSANDIERSHHHDIDICDGCRNNFVWARYNTRVRNTLVRINETIEIAGDFYLNDEDVIASAGYTRLTHPAYNTDTFYLAMNATRTSRGFVIKDEDAVATYDGQTHHIDDTWTLAGGDIFHIDEYLEDVEGLVIHKTDKTLVFTDQHSESDVISLTDYLIDIASKYEPQNRFAALGILDLESTHSAEQQALYRAMRRLIEAQYPELKNAALQQSLGLENAA